MESMTGKIVVVTGANSGIGKAAAADIAKTGAKVVLACRDREKAEAARAEIAAATGAGDRLEVMEVDLASFPSIRSFAKALAARHPKIDVLVNNAGLMSKAKKHTASGIELTFAVNHVGTHLLTWELLPLLKAAAPSRIVFVGSNLQKFAKLDLDDLMYERRKYGGFPVYSASKLASLMDMLSFRELLKGSGVTVVGLHPGVVDTGINRENAFFQLVARLFFISPAKAALNVVRMATDPALASSSGAFFGGHKELPINPMALDAANREKLWTLTEKLIGAAS